jgi:hypothetical protein
MELSLEEHIRQRAYEIWEQEGRPDGHDCEHWLQAQAEITALKRQDQKLLPRRGATKGKKNSRITSKR